jgi:4-amino-4-deoxy-L-arabinose transferase-like glycosyltransferase
MSERRLLLLVVGAAIAAGLVLRAWVLATSLGTLDADEAVWGLMARHALDGELSTFYWGQPYGGTHEVFLTAAVFAVFGSSTLALKLVPAALFAVAALLVWRVGRRTIGEPAARVAAALFWIWPSYGVWKSVRAHGFYGSALVLSLLVLLLVLRLRDEPSRRDAAALGLVLGLGWWATPQFALVAAPAVLWLLVVRRDALFRFWPALPAAVLGALPWLVANVRHDWYSFDYAPGGGTYLSRFRGFFTATLPMALDLRVPFAFDWALGPVVSGLLLLVALGWIGFLVVRRRSRLGPLIPVVLAFPFLYAASSFTWLVEEPRYLLLLMPVLALLLAEGLRRPKVAAVALAVAFALSFTGLERMEGSFRYENRTGHMDVPDDLTPLLDALDARGVRTVRADYWVAERITFESGERIVANSHRYPPFTERVEASTDPARVFVAGTPAERSARPDLLADGYGRVEIGGFVLYSR